MWQARWVGVEWDARSSGAEPWGWLKHESAEGRRTQSEPVWGKLAVWLQAMGPRGDGKIG